MMDKSIYFDNAATTFPKPREVYDFADTFYRNYGVNAGRGKYKLAQKANELIYDTRKECLSLFHVTNEKEIVFTHSATEAINMILRGLRYDKIKSVYISPFEHNAVLRTLYDLQKKHKFSIIMLDVENNGNSYCLEKIIEGFKKSPPDLVVLSHASNTNGLIAPYKEIFQEAKKYTAYTMLDIAQTAGFIDIDLSAHEIDFAVFAGHKTLFAPLGIGGFVFKRNIPITPLISGGTGYHSIERDMPDLIPEKFEAGSLNIYAIAGLYASIKWIKDMQMCNIRKREQELMDELIAILSSYKNLRMFVGAQSVSIVSCIFDNYSPDEMGYILSKKNICVRTGLHCAPLAHEALGSLPTGTVRFSLSYFNTKDDLYTLDKELKYIRDYT